MFFVMSLVYCGGDMAVLVRALPGGCGGEVLWIFLGRDVLLGL